MLTQQERVAFALLSRKYPIAAVSRTQAEFQLKHVQERMAEMGTQHPNTEHLRQRLADLRTLTALLAKAVH